MIDRQAVDLNRALKKERQLEMVLSGFEAALVAFSGGVDSAYLLNEALKVIGREKVLAVTVSSALIRPEEIEAAAALARKLQAEHLVLDLNLLENEKISDNPPERCYFCKKLIYTKLLEVASAREYGTVLDGSNADDLTDHRPGIRALEELDIPSPLLATSLGKSEIRLLAERAGLPVWDKPAAACLASRFPYGDKITGQKLKQVAEAESFLRHLGVKQDLRVRCHGDLARIEVNKTDLDGLLTQRDLVVAKMLELGFIYITLDLKGFESGSMNRLFRPPG
jgi:pyridinium-3,5-biscarboxylic acid mononucleotide sulfurtransferase